MNKRQILTLSEIKSKITESITITTQSCPIITFVSYYCYINEEILVVDGKMNEFVYDELKSMRVSNQYEVDPSIIYDEIGIEIIYVVKDDKSREEIKLCSKKEMKIYKKLQFTVPIKRRIK